MFLHGRDEIWFRWNHKYKCYLSAKIIDKFHTNTISIALGTTAAVLVLLICILCIVRTKLKRGKKPDGDSKSYEVCRSKLHWFHVDMTASCIMIGNK